MDDLAGLSWNSKPSGGANTANKPLNNAQIRSPPAFITPASSGRSTPLSSNNNPFASLQQAPKPLSKPSTPANDSFSSLLSLNSSKAASNSNLSLQERQRQLLEEKARQQKQQAQQNSADSHFWDSLGGSQLALKPANSGITPPPSGFGNSFLPPAQKASQSPKEDDLLAAFRSDAVVDSSSHFPVPKDEFADDDDDPFGLGSMPQRSSNAVSPAPAPTSNDDEDILGMLGRPVSELPRRPSPPPEASRRARDVSPDANANPQDKAVAELVDMGFPADKAAIALAQTESGTNVQAAVSFLLNQAHQEATQKSKARQRGDRESPAFEDEEYHRGGSRSASARREERQRNPAWMQGEVSRSGSRQRDVGNASRGEKETSQYASDIGSSLFKSANSLWKTGQKKVQKAMADFQDGDSSQPKWMREAAQQQAYADNSRQRTKESNFKGREDSQAEMTNEAMLLESDQGRRSKRPEASSMPRKTNPFDAPQHHRQDIGQPPQRQASPAWLQQGRPSSKGPEKAQTTKLSREAVEAQSAQAYVSPARRKKMTPTPGAEPLPAAAPSSSVRSSPAPPLHPNNPFSKPSPSASAPARTPPSASARSTPLPTRPKVPPRSIPSVSAAVLSASAAHRQKGGEAFKRGDYAAAQEAYGSALSQIPDTHPIIIVVLCNRALTSIKVGDPKAAVADADRAIAAIGPSKGSDEKIALGGTDGEKDMREFFGKALMRKAEALENMEKWNDALSVWREAVEAGVGGAVSMQGRTRCERAVGRANQAAAPAKKAAPRPPPAAPVRSALQDLGGAPAADSEAVKRMKAANAAAQRTDDEKFALTDQVDAKLTEWKGTKSDNLRALLGSLDKVLWADAGWTKVNMADLVMPNRVKIVYMKAIAKVHPDKVCSAFSFSFLPPCPARALC